MLWFRRKKREPEEAPTAAAPHPVLEEQEGQPAQDGQGPPEGGPDEEPERKRPRRRRGTRGGRGRRKATEVTVAEEPEEEEKQEEKPKTKPRARRQRAPAKRPALPDVKKDNVASDEVGEQRVAVLEDGKHD